MSSVQAILHKLSQLTAEDRQWVLGRLPAEHKRKLLDNPRPQSVPNVPVGEAASAVDAVDRVSAQTMHALLATEPAWFSAAVIGSRDWSWRDDYMRLLSAVDRRELHDTLHQGNSLTPKMEQALLEGVAECLRTAAVVQAAQESRFESLLQKLAAKRSRRRWSGAP